MITHRPGRCVNGRETPPPPGSLLLEVAAELRVVIALLIINDRVHGTLGPIQALVLARGRGGVPLTGVRSGVPALCLRIAAEGLLPGALSLDYLTGGAGAFGEL